MLNGYVKHRLPTNTQPNISEMKIENLSKETSWQVGTPWPYIHLLGRISSFCYKSNQNNNNNNNNNNNKPFIPNFWGSTTHKTLNFLKEQ